MIKTTPFEMVFIIRENMRIIRDIYPLMQYVEVWEAEAYIRDIPEAKKLVSVLAKEILAENLSARVINAVLALVWFVVVNEGRVVLPPGKHGDPEQVTGEQGM